MTKITEIMFSTRRPEMPKMVGAGLTNSDYELASWRERKEIDENTERYHKEEREYAFIVSQELEERIRECKTEVLVTKDTCLSCEERAVPYFEDTFYHDKSNNKPIFARIVPSLLDNEYIKLFAYWGDCRVADDSNNNCLPGLNVYVKNNGAPVMCMPFRSGFSFLKVADLSVQEYMNGLFRLVRERYHAIVAGKGCSEKADLMIKQARILLSLSQTIND